jgi:toxin ParE1/3/4
VKSRYLIRPRADQDLNERAVYFAKEANPELGHRFLLAAHETFGLLATQPQMGWHARLRHVQLSSMRVFRITGFEKILVLYQPRGDGVEVLRVVHASRNLQALLSRKTI